MVLGSWFLSRMVESTSEPMVKTLKKNGENGADDTV
jgi:hypothetical protein